MKFKETEYGSPSSVRKELEELGIISSSFEIKFISYDIETVPFIEETDGKTFSVQKPVSIGYFDGQTGEVFTGENLVPKFIGRLRELQVSLFYTAIGHRTEFVSCHNFRAVTRLRTSGLKSLSQKSVPSLTLVPTFLNKHFLGETLLQSSDKNQGLF